MKPKQLIWLAPLALVGCDPGPKSSRGFRLPDGDVEAGQVAFEQLGCVGCHTVEGAEFAVPAEERAFDVPIGGKVRRVRSYGQLVTAIINPSHDISSSLPTDEISRDGESLMLDFNATMTVEQMIDLVAFLQSAYEEYLPRDYDPYFP